MLAGHHHDPTANAPRDMTAEQAAGKIAATTKPAEADPAATQAYEHHHGLWGSHYDPKPRPDAAHLAKLAWEYARGVGAAIDEQLVHAPELRLRYRANPFAVYEHGPAATRALSLPQILTARDPERDASLLPALVSRVVDGTLRHASDDASVYTGTAGAAWLLFKIHNADPGFALGSRSALAIAHNLAERAHATAFAAIQRSQQHHHHASSALSGVGFLCTPVGALAVAAAVRHHYRSGVEYAGEPAAHGAGGAPDAVVADTLAQLNAYIRRHAFSPACPSELLYGRAGLVAALQFVARHIPETRNATHAYGQALPIADLLPNLVEAILEDGRRGSATLAHSYPDAPRLTLAWAWHDKWYLSAAHGAAGILTVLLALPDELIAPYLDVIKQAVMDLAHLNGYPTTLDKLCTSYTQATDPAHAMVQWCHGAVGFGLLFVRAFAKFGDLEYLARATACGELAWEQGIVDKHVGLCHGVAGNAYLFLALWRATRLRPWYQRTLAFALTAAHRQGGHCDHPSSVWEGWGGLASLLADLLVTPEPVVEHNPEHEQQSATLRDTPAPPRSPSLETEAGDMVSRTALARAPRAVEAVTAAVFHGFPCVDDC
ncbi:hypothetical protein AMAG_07278 [Allomyces macrogynus ATCC 38327]|uniref:Uncharacterized protein n=1 Tax=Allomyces macrogynus (strain ATCC 38327) TaxID=578462 RepID=A0A0L0SI53_ALLM3|nr:hypothetical protein AMAG_07278 [Allomyces macrogynus ATCC 38327]|eukprot:KNE62020.1 hypothetical protein AMAG_07278 [Allomyces macrogynus ATCC 38327]